MYHFLGVVNHVVGGRAEGEQDGLDGLARMVVTVAYVLDAGMLGPVSAHTPLQSYTSVLKLETRVSLKRLNFLTHGTVL